MKYLGVQTDDEDLVTKKYVDDSVAPLTRMWFGTRAEYNALEEIDPAVCYCIEEGT